MYVKDNMVADPTCIGKDQSVSEAIDMMADNELHRIPVVDRDNKLIGLITQRVIERNTPSQTTSLSVFELNYLLNKLTVNDIMIRDVITISKDALLEEAATKLRKYDIGCLPVVEEDGTLIGIITHNDIFTAFIDLLGYNQDGIRYVISIPEDKTGIMRDIADVITRENASISNLAVYHNSRGIEVVVIIYGHNDVEDKLTAAGYAITSKIFLHE